MNSADGSVELRFCLECKTFIPKEMFKDRRRLCRNHYNRRMRSLKLQAWNENPQKRKAYIAWQIAYIDSRNVFKQIINITPTEVLSFLEDIELSRISAVRLVPVDPSKPLSVKNCCLTSPETRKDMCNVWKRIQCWETYSLFFDPTVQRPIYAMSD
jgi:hypothetical protein